MEDRIAVFYLEDNSEDAAEFAGLVAMVLHEPSPAKDGVRSFLQKQNIDWHESCKEGIAALDKGDYAFFILDIMCEGEAESGFALIREIRRRRQYRTAHIWILSHFLHFRGKSLREHRVDRFFSKSHPEELKQELEWILLPEEKVKAAQEEYLEIHIGRKQMMRIPVDHVICVVVSNDRYDLWIYNDQDCVAVRKVYYEDSSLMKSILAQAEEKNIVRLHRVDRNHIINTDMVTGVRKQNGVIYIKMRQIPEEIRVSRRNNKLMEAIFGQLLPQE